MVFCQNQAENRLLVLTQHLNPLFKLSENHKINIVGPTELKLWPFKGALFNATVTCIYNS